MRSEGISSSRPSSAPDSRRTRTTQEQTKDIADRKEKRALPSDEKRGNVLGEIEAPRKEEEPKHGNKFKAEA